ncbi:MAG: serine--tRNA ligase [Rhodospirillaceae bacterium]|jgi:seryl-tRNA synthetase|nr:serine--tRNA ligase [Rhodospirillaceae bacterium]MBT5013344.1 serine--tRNA ligase [Rhodospirillaceae bacterium]MBT5308024.1 serine--tRNA ligase [Rhodospirillaceae bacterium]MBT6407283.1 serine--tRNA ligase [Rhodospirillaceae bacterium]MBT7356249.1 serine--tRNA ligase [Rhodospirillaceae bacterium]
MFDIKWIRDNAEAFDAGLARRKLDGMSAGLIELDKTRRDAETRAQEIQAERNKLSKQIGVAKASGEDASEIIAEVSRSKQAQSEAEEEARIATDKLNDVLMGIPNLPLDDVPDGADEDDNREERTWGTPPSLDFEAKEHFDLGEALGLMDFETAAKMSGARFVLLSGPLARMERALMSLMLDMHTTEHELLEVNPPALVRDSALYGTGQLPKFGEDLFKTEDDLWLIPTAEVPLTNIVAGEILDEETMPRRYTAMTWCFRSEAGSAGKDTRGMIRQHQFSKVEMVSVVTPDQSDAELERMAGCAEAVLQRLELPYRVVTLCTGDLGFGARKTYDLEVWLPGQDRYREISSCSTCGDFQARRMKARCRATGEKSTRFVHTLNGSGLAVGRTLIAVLENYQQADGSIVVPDALQPYMGGLKVIGGDV